MSVPINASWQEHSWLADCGKGCDCGIVRVSRAKWRAFLKCLQQVSFARRSDAPLPYPTPTGENRVSITRQGDPSLRLPTNCGRKNHLFASSAPPQRTPQPEVGQITQIHRAWQALGIIILNTSTRCYTTTRCSNDPANSRPRR